MAGPIDLARKAHPRKPAGLPSKKQILEFIEGSDRPAGKREIARAFGLKGQEKVKLKALLKDMADEGLIDGRKSAFHKMGGLPRVTVLKIVDIDGNQPVAVPERWEAEAHPKPRLRVVERGRRGALGVGDRILARTEEAGRGWRAHPMKKLQRASEQVMGVVEKVGDSRYYLKPVDKKQRYDTQISGIGDAQEGDLVLATIQGRGARSSAKVEEILGDPFAPKAVSLIAIHKYGIPHEMPDAAEKEAALVSDLPVTPEKREDLRHLPIIAIDPRDARDYDDAIWAQANDEGGFDAIVAIADVSYYVRPSSALDKEARKRGNSVYFPDRVVPMLPHTLSSDKCSLRAGEDRAVMACHLKISAEGKVTSWRFSRAIARISANIPYEDAQKAIDGRLAHEMLEPALKPLWACWRVLRKARDKRGPLALFLPERRITLDEEGRVTGVAVKQPLEAHSLVEDFMVAANVAAAKALEAKKAPLVYRAHENPSREKLLALKDYLVTFDIEFALGQVIKPSSFNRILKKIESREDAEEIRPQIMEAVLRSQTQAYYTPTHIGHFGLALGSYAHFTSPIRRYADLLIHRALVGAYGLEQPQIKNNKIQKTTALSGEEASKLDTISEAISRTERRAMEAERETIDRYVAAYLSEQVGQIVEARITGVQNFGFFATVEAIGGDGLIPVSTLGTGYFDYDEGAQSLTSEDGETVYRPGMRLQLRLAEANPVSGSLRFELPEVRESARKFAPTGKRQGKYRVGKRGRPSNIRHKGKRKRR